MMIAMAVKKKTNRSGKERKRKQVSKTLTFTSFGYISRVSSQNGISRLYVIVEKYHSGRKPSKFLAVT